MLRCRAQEKGLYTERISPPTDKPSVQDDLHADLYVGGRAPAWSTLIASLYSVSGRLKGKTMAPYLFSTSNEWAQRCVFNTSLRCLSVQISVYGGDMFLHPVPTNVMLHEMLWRHILALHKNALLPSDNLLEFCKGWEFIKLLHKQSVRIHLSNFPMTQVDVRLLWWSQNKLYS